MDADTENLIREMWSDLASGYRNGLKKELGTFEARMNERFDALAARFEALEKGVDKLETEFAAFKRIAIENFARIQRNFELLLAEVRDPIHKARLDEIEARLARLEQHVGLAEE